VALTLDSHISRLHHCDDLEERLETVAKRKAATRHQKPPKRRKIPDQNRAFTSVADIDDCEALPTRKSRDIQLAKLARLKGKADKLDVRVQELTAKRERYLSKENDGKGCQQLGNQLLGSRGGREGERPLVKDARRYMLFRADAGG